MPSVAIVDDHALVLEGLARLLGGCQGGPFKLEASPSGGAQLRVELPSPLHSQP